MSSTAIIYPQSLPYIYTKLQEAANDPGAYQVKITTTKGRSLDQNALFHKWCEEVANAFQCAGITHMRGGPEVNKENIKTFFKKEYLHTIYETAWSYAKNCWVKRVIPARTRDLDVATMFEFMCCVQSWCCHHDIQLTIPQDCQYDKLRKKNA